MFTYHRASRGRGRLFFALELNWLLPAQITQIDIVAIVKVSGQVNNQTQHFLLPVFASAGAPPRALLLDLSTTLSAVEVEHDHELTYTFSYTNSRQGVLDAMTFHLLLPPGATIRPLTGAPLNGSAGWLRIVNKHVRFT